MEHRDARNRLGPPVAGLNHDSMRPCSDADQRAPDKRSSGTGAAAGIGRLRLGRPLRCRVPAFAAQPLFGCRAPMSYCLANLESLELGMAEIERLVISSLLMCGAEGFGSSPCFEGGAAFPY
jgi:hypothetical protein